MLGCLEDKYSLNFLHHQERKTIKMCHQHNVYRRHVSIYKGNLKGTLMQI